MNRKFTLAGLALAALVALACNLPGQPPASASSGPEPITIFVSATPAETASGGGPTAAPSTDDGGVSLTNTPLPNPPTATQIPPTDIPQLSATPAGCQRPPDDMTRVRIADGIILNQRTISMLETAQALYGGDHVFLYAITQGSYNTSEPASFGTHDGGGAVDLSVRNLSNWNHILYEEFPIIILALRQAGFAAWVRDTGDLYADSPIHIHAIAVGDPDLSEAAKQQLTGVEGYFRGFNGLPVDPPIADNYGGPYICPWMQEMGYSDLRN
jgi:hypothetical protein